MKPESTIRRDARDRAVKVLIQSYEGEALCHDLLAEMQSHDKLSESDAALAAELAIGVSRHRITCEHIASRFHRGRWVGLRIPIRVIIAAGVYQLCWLDRIPDHAAVDQAVRQAKRHGRGSAATVNVILRKVAQSRGDVVDRPEEPDSRRYLPLDSTRGRLFNENIFPDPSRQPLHYIVSALSHPSWLVERWHRRFKPQLCREVCQAGLRRPLLSLRPNRLRIDAAGLIERLTEEGRSAEIGPDGESVIVHDAPSAATLAVVAEGLAQPQDSTAGVALRLAEPKPGGFLIDLCAGVGTKSTQAAEMMNNTGVVIATDTQPQKLERIAEAADRLGLSVIQTAAMDDLDDVVAKRNASPDIILTDVPCLNTGVLARRPEARYRAGHKALMAIVEIQRSILERAAALAGPHTKIVYSTCSLEPEENEQQIDAFVKDRPAWRIERSQMTLPNASRDGGYAAVLSQGEPTVPNDGNT